MPQAARLITPQGEIITLAPDLYEAILNMLKGQEPAPKIPKAELMSIVKETRGKYAGGKPLVKALLKERAIERARELERDQKRAKQFFEL